MRAFISTFNDKTKIELVDDNGFHLDTIEVDSIHVEINRENIEPINIAHKPKLCFRCKGKDCVICHYTGKARVRAGRFYAN